MGVVIDVLFAVAVVALAPGAVPEFQLGEFGVRPAADSAAVGIGCYRLCCAGLIRACVREGNRAGFLCRLLFEQPAGIDPPGQGDHIHNILAEEQEIVGKRNDTEQIVGEGIDQ